MNKTRLKKHLWCRNCGADWPYSGTTTYTTCLYCFNKIDARDRRGESKRRISDSESFKRWSDDPEKLRSSYQRHHVQLRKRAFFKICGSIFPKCVRCRCDDIRLLEINHKTLIGKHRPNTGHSFCRSIVNGTQSVDNLELLCRPCNAIHYLELKLGEALPIKVVWQYNETNND